MLILISMGILVMEFNFIENQTFHFQLKGQNISILGVDMSSSAHIDNKEKDILVLEKGPT